MMLVSAGIVFPVSHRKHTANGWHRKLYVKESMKLDQIKDRRAGEAETVPHRDTRRSAKYILSRCSSPFFKKISCPDLKFCTFTVLVICNFYFL